MKTWLIGSFVFVLSAISIAQIPASSHVVMVVEDSHSYSNVIGNNSMPYLNSLASQYGLATQYYANTHPAIGNYFEMTTGSVLTNDNTRTPSNFPVTADNIVDQLMVSGKTWKSYAEGLPYAGYTGGDTGNYAVRNNPFAYFADVQNSTTQKQNLVPFSQFAADLSNNQLPDFSYIVPSTIHDGQNGGLQQADTWLKQNIAPLLADAAFQQDGLLIITFNQSTAKDTTHGGGQVATLVIGPQAKLAYKSTTVYQHQSLLHTVLASLGATSFPGTSAAAPLMSDFFATTSTASPATSALAKAATASPAYSYTAGVTISSPTSGATTTSPVNFVASAKSSSRTYPISAMRIYVDSTSVYTVSASSINTSLPVAAGAHNVTIVAWDKSGKSYTNSVSITVGATTTTTPGSVTISTPANGATVTSPTQFIASAQAPSGRTITAMQIYVDSVSAYSTNASSLNTSLTLTSGAHNIVIQAWDSTGVVYKSSRSITVASGTTSSTTLTATPSSLNFGSVNIGSSTSQSVTLQAGSSPVTISQANITSGYTFTGLSLPLTIAAGQSASFSVTFTPTTAASLIGSLSLTSNASSTTTIALSGTGTTSTTSSGHSVTLSWTDSSTGISGYNVYRGTQSTGPYTKLTSSTVAATSYQDTSVTAGATYSYVVTAVSTSGTESAYSAATSATIP